MKKHNMNALSNFFDNQKLTLTGYGVTLQRIQENMLETVREWRNSEYVSKYMVSKDKISSDEQKKWFAKIRKSASDFIFIIYYNGKAIGVCSIFDIDIEKKTSNAGIYIAVNEYKNTGLALKAIFLLADFSFIDLKIEYWETKVHKLNKQAMRLNALIGYKKISEDTEFDTYILESSVYFSTKNRLVNIISQY